MSQRNSHFRFSPRLLDHLGVSAYNSVPKCLAELAANAYDADASEVDISLPDKLTSDAEIVVRDNGSGMTSEEIENKFLYIGRNKREDGQRTPSGRLKIGSKGLGKLAGFGIASQVVLSSTTEGQASTVTIDRTAFQGAASLTAVPMPLETRTTTEGHGTVLTLRSLNPGLRLPALEKLREQLYRSIPRRVGFRVFVNHVECTALDLAGEKVSFAKTIPDLGEVTGYYVVTATRQDRPGFAVRVRDRLVKEPSLFGLGTGSHGFFTASKLSGEVNAEFFDPEDASGDQPDLINTSRDGFLEDSPSVQRFNEWMRIFVTEIVHGLDERETERRASTILGTPEVQQRLGALPPHVRGTATSIVREILRKLKYVEETESSELIEWLLRYYESNVMRELMRAIVEADASEAERLASLIQDWGLKQLNSINEIIRDQIRIIDKLQHITFNDETWEIEVHRLVEKNLWLLREGLELWSSNKPLKTVLEQKIAEAYAKKQHLRPDVICRSRNGSHAVVVEFKRPKEVICMDHVTQALGYTGVLRAHSPGLEIQTYVIGREYDSEVLAAKDNLEKASVFLWSFSDVLQRARIRFEKILDILGR